jgi:hypothetical protein
VFKQWNFQHGFWENRSTETACQNFIELIQKRLNDGEHVLGIFLDLSKAYDVINHEVCLESWITMELEG